MSQAPLTIVNLVATSYSGSTWANMLLGSHSQGFSVGEMDWIAKTGQALCTLHGANCPLWQRFEVNSPVNPFEQIAQLTGRRLLVVTNTRRYLDAQQHADFARRYVFLYRDGRAVAASAKRKYPQTPFWRCARNWARSIAKRHAFIRQQDPATVIEVCYEKLQQETASELRRICAFLELEYEPNMLAYHQAEHHVIGGNPGAMSTVADAQHLGALHNPIVGRQELDAPQNKLAVRNAGQVDLDHYRANAPDQFRDERWKKELTNWQLRQFALLAGRWNRRLGYPPALDRQTPPAALRQA